MTFAFFYRASLGGPDERREQKFATLVGDHFGMSPTNILLTPENGEKEADAVGINESLGEKEEGRMDASHSSQSFFLPHPL
ncbi:hypothetical protein IC805_14940 [Geobacillus thermoleovorans]|uniref:hypothetical protein n=1 Tax=Geobacillus thermoleovorans TaxID=33941 RepID=UPI0016817D88|nr:hypothetical protein [Geobacillus thermoleovorans]QNU20744.1 hypothetical protein IC805_14940 [Geobacillus thermoleovorans]